MSKQLPAYAPEAKCPKCGCEEVRTNYCAGEKSTLSRYGELCYHGNITKEHHHRLCTRCRYEWLEACLSVATLVLDPETLPEDQDQINRDLREMFGDVVTVTGDAEV